jgi:hypothetical protein
VVAIGVRAQQQRHPGRVAAGGQREAAIAGAEQDPEQRQQRIARRRLQHREHGERLERLEGEREAPAAVADHPVEPESGGGDQAHEALDAGSAEGHGRAADHADQRQHQQDQLKPRERRRRKPDGGGTKHLVQ